MIKTCIFDLDGTLINSMPAIMHYGNTALLHYGFPTHTQEKYRYFIGSGAAVLVHRMLGEYDTEENFKNVKAMYDRLYESDVTYNTLPYDGICELLSSLSDFGINTAVLSNKPHNVTTTVVEKLFGTNTFDICFGQRDGVPKKPSPDAALTIINKLNCRPDETLFIGDTDIDIKTGKNSGFITTGVLWGFRDKDELEKAGADFIINTPKDILNIISKNV